MADTILNRDVAVDAINNNAYLLNCQCPACGQNIDRGYNEEYRYCGTCGQKLHIPAFTAEAVQEAHFQSELDDYES